MSAQEQLEMLLTARAFDSAGAKVGDVRQVYLDDSTGRATFATVATGIFSADAIVPLFGARLLDGELHLDHTKATIKSSPRFDHTEDALTPEQELDLLEHFGIEAAPLGGDESRDDDATSRGTDAAAAAGAGAKKSSDDSGKAEPGTIPARRLASVEEPRDTPETDVTKKKAAAATAATGAAAATTAGAAAKPGEKPDAKDSAKAGDKQTSEQPAKPAAASKPEDPKREDTKDTPAKPTDAKQVGADDKDDKDAAGSKDAAADKGTAATGSLASKLTATAKQAGKDDDAARPSSIEKAGDKATDNGEPKNDAKSTDTK